jgi:YHS domain-containing protein
LPLEENDVKKIVKLKQKTFWFCSEDCYKEFISFPIGTWRNNILK